MQLRTSCPENSFAKSSRRNLVTSSHHRFPIFDSRVDPPGCARRLHHDIAGAARSFTPGSTRAKGKASMGRPRRGGPFGSSLLPFPCCRFLRCGLFNLQLPHHLARDEVQHALKRLALGGRGRCMFNLFRLIGRHVDSPKVLAQKKPSTIARAGLTNWKLRRLRTGRDLRVARSDTDCGGAIEACGSRPAAW